MHVSTDRILTTHVGSLPRSAAVTEMVYAEENDRPIDHRRFDAVIAEAVRDAIARQRKSGVDVVSDGEMSKISYATYIRHRLTGFAGDSPRRVPQDLEAYPNYLGRAAKGGTTPTYRRPRCVGPIAVKTLDPLHVDIATMKAALAGSGATEGFMNSASPGVIALFQPDEHYGDHRKYLEAIGNAMQAEYEAIAASGLLIQIDSPDLALGRHMMFKGRGEAEFLAMAELHVEVLNHALRNVPRDSVRLHICWGNYEGPHHCDIDLEKILPIVVKARARAISFEGANPRHAHEWRAFTRTKIPDDLVLMPGVLDSTSNFIEHPELVAERIERFAAIVGRERVIASSDCGFSTFAGFGVVDPDIVYAKLEALAQGAAIASARLWGRPD
ncbi:MAG: cobalamin-independent methionine synthase II family protein [Alphaproteobacteria bacterium]|nr:cobalamin-independent methionine synthase II family protein [Alphaproteobacteria bacterium]